MPPRHVRLISGGGGPLHDRKGERRKGMKGRELGKV